MGASIKAWLVSLMLVILLAPAGAWGAADDGARRGRGDAAAARSEARQRPADRGEARQASRAEAPSRRQEANAGARRVRPSSDARGNVNNRARLQQRREMRQEAPPRPHWRAAREAAMERLNRGNVAERPAFSPDRVAAPGGRGAEAGSAAEAAAQRVRAHRRAALARERAEARGQQGRVTDSGRRVVDVPRATDSKAGDDAAPAIERTVDLLPGRADAGEAPARGRRNLRPMANRKAEPRAPAVGSGPALTLEPTPDVRPKTLDREDRQAQPRQDRRRDLDRADRQAQRRQLERVEKRREDLRVKVPPRARRVHHRDYRDHRDHRDYRDHRGHRDYRDHRDSHHDPYAGYEDQTERYESMHGRHYNIRKLHHQRHFSHGHDRCHYGSRCRHYHSNHKWGYDRCRPRSSVWIVFRSGWSDGFGYHSWYDDGARLGWWRHGYYRSPRYYDYPSWRHHHDWSPHWWGHGRHYLRWHGYSWHRHHSGFWTRTYDHGWWYRPWCSGRGPFVLFRL